ncbi:DUF6445 family protein [Luteimonas sp. BDR2-5]|uniref:DUF6445 family protein n=1 Tax=Proluteimonas luteida TaxID=2878685 RepID=UPI001E46852A|nr:DUF6445 family protein [Luteimonas sp. BDR2-5]MCD9027367.1 DUF6445 family protein [Luteimonas sp. BDR2-5]
MRTSLLVVDDFLSARDATSLRNAGLGLTYPEQEGAFPGRNSLERIHIPGIVPAVSHLVGEQLRPIEPLHSHAKFRITRAADVGRGRVHIDGPVEWSGILYLSRPEDCRGGTEFFRHLPTGTDHAPTNAAELAAMGLDSYDAVEREVIARDSNDASKWEMTMRVPMRFNRLVLLRPWMWHSAGEAFGDTMENARFVYLLFFTRG